MAQPPLRLSSCTNESTLSRPPRKVQQAILRAPGSLVFNLRLGSNNELEYRGPTSTAFGVKIPALLGPQVSSAGAQHCPNNQQEAILLLLPERDVFEYYLDLFLEWQNSSIIIVAGILVDDLLVSYDPETIPWRRQLLVISVLALATKFTDDSQTSLSSDEYMLKAKSMLDMADLEAPSIEVVQSACILACREYASGHENTAWVFNSELCPSTP
jgi:hypothetical protein